MKEPNCIHGWTEPPECPWCVAQERDALSETLRRLTHDIEAYRGALGYSVPGDHDGKLSNGTVPQCGMCNSQDRMDKRRRLDTVRCQLESALIALEEGGNRKQYDPSWIRPKSLPTKEVSERCIAAYHNIHAALALLPSHDAQ